MNGGIRQVNVLTNLGVADYDGLQTQLSYRGHSRIFASIGYTLSKATNTSEPDGNGVGPNENNIMRLGEEERGPSLLDQRHRAVLSFLYRFPYEISAGTVTQLASARPFNATTGIDNNVDGAKNDRPVVNGSVISKSAFRGTRTEDVSIFVEERLKLRHQALLLRLLELLVKRPLKALSKAEIHETIWPGTYVSDTSLAQLVSEIRGAIGDDAHEPRFLRTVHGFGYAFAGDAIGTRAGAAVQGSIVCWLRLADRDIPLGEGENVLGRDPIVTVRLDSLRISRYHARIVVNGDEAVLEDLGSKNGTYLREARIAQPERLPHGDALRIGPFSLTFHVNPAGVTTETEVR